MNGGVLHAVEVCSLDDEVDLEQVSNQRYEMVIPDDLTIVNAFKLQYESHAAEFAPLSP